MSFPYPYVIIVSDGKSIRTVKPAQLGMVAPDLDAALCKLLLTVDPATPPATPPVATHPADKPNHDLMSQAEIARTQGYEGECCDQCGQFKMKRAGHCLVCEACGTTTGCS